MLTPERPSPRTLSFPPRLTNLAIFAAIGIVVLIFDEWLLIHSSFATTYQALAVILSSSFVVFLYTARLKRIDDAQQRIEIQQDTSRHLLEDIVSVRTAELVAANEALVAETINHKRKEEKFRSLFDSIDSGFCIVEMIFDELDNAIDYRYLEVNPSFEKQTGLADPIGKKVSELLPNLDPHWFEIFGKIALTGEPARFENRSKPLNRWYDVYAFRFGAPENKQVAIFFNDISERKRDQITKRRLTEQLLAAGEEERRRFARELHDETGQTLSAVCVRLRRAEQKLMLANQADTEILSELKMLQEYLQIAHVSLRRMAHDLHPSELEHFGLSQAIASYLRRLAYDSTTIINVVLPTDFPRLNKTFEIIFYRITQEAVSNALKHADARLISVRLFRDEETITLEIENDGRGFVMAETHGGIGLVGMRERAEMIGSELKIVSAIDGGTCVSLRAKINPQTINHATDPVATLARQTR